MRDIGPEEAKIRAQTGTGLSDLDNDSAPFRSVAYDPTKDRDPCPWCGKRLRKCD